VRQTQSWYIARFIALVTVAAFVVPAVSTAGTYKTLHKFTGPDGAAPLVGLIFDAAGNLYGTTRSGGQDNCGVVFKLTRNSGGNWTESVLHSFVESASDGCSPVASLIFDAAGNLYGTTGIGGIGCGVVFELTPGAHGAWGESILYFFGDNRFVDGCIPEGNLIFDTAGNLYGTTQTSTEAAESGPQGTVFKLAHNADGSWAETILFGFDEQSGISPLAGLVFDHSGNLYGTANEQGGTSDRDYGVAFKLAPNSDGTWTESILHQFTNNTSADGNDPASNLIFDAAGNLYGTTTAGGSGSDGVVFKLTPNAKGGWTEKILHAFHGADGDFPYAGLIFDAAGNLYGTTELGNSGHGVVFEMTPRTDGTWALNVLYDFSGAPASHPVAGLLLDKAGNLYGTARDCAPGTGCSGVVFEITP
jgi:uncharacterized repeat protein (TIGR03803 family)